MSADYREIDRENRKRFLALDGHLTDDSGIYILFREQDGIKYAYVGQAKHILKRLSQHLSGFQHIDLSLKKHGLVTEKPNGWNVYVRHYPESELDEAERYWIQRVASQGYQLRNKTLGGQDEGKGGLDNQKPSRNYHDGLAQGRKSLAKELKHIIDTHLEVKVKKDNKITQKALAKFWELLNFENEKGENDNEN